MPHAEVHYLDGMAFEARADSGHSVRLDAAPDFGGDNSGFRPTELTAISLAGCTGIDVISILKKMRVEIKRFDISVDASRREQHPKVFERIRLTYTLEADHCQPKQFQRAVELSQTTYCTVSAMLEKTAVIERILYLNGEKLEG